ncbi:unnamed protein product [Didymodactylos carnosus]|uniref:Uncharacterized protein n=1 Tax=Didymodactylos carnosus TaxID=1234261 RepID=A0A8S2JU63_9BILA|nr:unnamed protein product [Didymodactylos carnosus]CAF3822864.1 unnamed protein product [Didymodactylos carnosus]
MPNQKLLELSGQPPLESILRRNRLRWFGHVIRTEDERGDAALTKKAMFSYFPDWKRPRNIGIRKRWETKVMDDIEKSGIKNWRRDIREKDKWREIINIQVKTIPPQTKLKDIVHKYKERAENRRLEETTGIKQRKVTEILVKKRYILIDFLVNVKSQFIEHRADFL